MSLPMRMIHSSIRLIAIINTRCLFWTFTIRTTGQSWDSLPGRDAMLISPDAQLCAPQLCNYGMFMLLADLAVPGVRHWSVSGHSGHPPTTSDRYGLLGHDVRVGAELSLAPSRGLGNHGNNTRVCCKINRNFTLISQR